MTFARKIKVIWCVYRMKKRDFCHLLVDTQSMSRLASCVPNTTNKKGNVLLLVNRLTPKTIGLGEEE